MKINVRFSLLFFFSLPFPFKADGLPLFSSAELEMIMLSFLLLGNGEGLFFSFPFFLPEDNNDNCLSLLYL